MSEYWKSTPKYWCKFCEVYVRDTKLDRQQHESTGRHKGNIQKNLRELHKKHAQDEREKSATQREADRIRAKVTGEHVPSSTSKTATSATPTAPRATADDRKRQIEQLAAMGVAVPEEYRKELAMAGEWQTQSYTRVEDYNEIGLGDSTSVGVRKRKAEDDDEEDELEAQDSSNTRRGPWGSRIKTMKVEDQGRVDFDQLLGNAVKKEDRSRSTVETDDHETRVTTKSEPSDEHIQPGPQTEKEEEESKAIVKTEEIELAGSLHEVSGAPALQPSHEEAPVVFKKRKGRPNKTQ